MGTFFGYIGRRAITSINHFLNLAAFTLRLISLIFRHQKDGRTMVRRVIVEQIYFTAVQALPIIVPFALIIGSMHIIQLSQLSGQVDTGKAMVLSIVREIGPLITALVVILRSATAVTIETSYMKIFHEIEALEMVGIDPMRIICLSRLVGITSAILSLFIIFDLVAIIGGYGIVWMITYIPMGNFFDQILKGITATDIFVGLLKAVFFGVVITVVCLYHGFESKKQITEIPLATSRSSVECFLYCLGINIFVSVIFYL
jgi:phospholipid/cholesterol/gamma-HCH transport system permease protein